jgi:hypothetical protein
MRLRFARAGKAGGSPGSVPGMLVRRPAYGMQGLVELREPESSVLLFPCTWLPKKELSF